MEYCLIFELLNSNLSDLVKNAEPKPLKILIRDTLLVYICVIAGMFILDQLNPVINEFKTIETPKAFTDNPPF